MRSSETDCTEAKVGIDCRSLVNGPAGITTYVLNLLHHISFLERLDARWPRNNFLWNQIRPQAAQLRRRWAVYHAPAYTGPLWSFCPVVLSVADISYLVRSEWYPYQTGAGRRRFYLSSLEKADRIIVPSRFSQSELLNRYPQYEDKTRCIYLGVSPFFRKDQGLAERVRSELKLPPSFLLHVGDIHPRRQLDKLAETAEKLKMPLVLVGHVLQGGEAFKNWPFLYSDITPERLKGLYSAATAFVYASKYEGFGLPLVEAMACELPVVAARRSCVPEVCGEAAVLVESEVDDLVEGVRRALAERRLYVNLGLKRAAEFRWEDTAAQTVQVYQELF